MSDFRKGMFWTAIPIIVLSVTSAVLSNFAGMGSTTSGFLLVAVTVYGVAALIIATISVMKDKKQIASGIFAGLGIASIIFFISCFVAAMSSFG